MNLSFSFLIVMLLAVPLCGIGVLALYERLRSSYRPLKEREHVHFCSGCEHVYSVSNRRPMNQCPRCGKLNDALIVNDQSQF
jgi:rRNA maturation endonuclease Nob1